MTIRIGQATTCTSILPNSRALARVNPKKLSPDARFRLRFIDCYRQGQQAGGGIRRTVTEVCRLFGIARSLFYKWYNRFDPSNLSSLEDRSSRPHRVRQATYDTTLISLIRQYRQDKDFATYSGKKLGLPPANIEKNRKVYDAGIRSLEIAREAGVVMGWGTDLIGETQNRQAREFAIRAEVETGKEILRAMYQVNPRLDGKIGRLTPGAHADIVLTNVNPLDDIAGLSDAAAVTHVVMAGKVMRGL